MTVPPRRLLVVDDDAPQLAMLASDFARFGFAVEGTSCPATMHARLRQADFALVVLEPLVRPGPALLRELLTEHGLPVIVHSTACGEADRIAALEMGAEDCIAKPAHPRELLARIRAALRGRTPQAVPARSSSICFDGWRLDLASGQLFDPAGSPVPLSSGELQLLRVFVERPRQVLDRAHLLDHIHGAQSDHFDRSIDVQLCRLRRKLSASGLNSPVIRTVRNEGYMFVHPVNA